MRALVTAIAVALLATACKPAADATPAGAATAATATVATPVAAPMPAEPAPAPTHLRGKGIMGKDGFGLTLCGEETQRIAVLDDEARGLLDGYLAGGAHEFEFDGWGDLVGMEKVHVTSFERVAAEGGGCDARDGGFAFRAHGTEPFWNLDVGADQATLTRPDKPDLAGPVKVLPEDHGIRSVEAATGEGRLLARFTRAHCNDGMADAMFGWRAEVTLGAEKFSGCALAGTATPVDGMR